MACRGSEIGGQRDAGVRSTSEGAATLAVATPRRRTRLTQLRRPTLERGARRFAWGLFAPSLVLVVVVTILPIAQALRLSMSEAVGFEFGSFIGLENYARFFSDPLSRTNLVNTAVFTVASMALTMPLAVGLAVLLNREFPGRTLVRTLLIMPWIISQLLAALMWRWVASPDIGPVGYALTTLAGTRVELFGGTTSAMVGIVLANVWRTFPYALILVLAALQTVPKDIYEAGRVDGATPFQEFRYLTLPLIQGTIVIAMIILTINAVNMVELPLILTGGGPLNATDLVGLRVFREAFQFQKFGIASAAAVVMFFINVVFSLAYIKVLRGERASSPRHAPSPR
jgi:multiple sugar transport system permease protein